MKIKGGRRRDCKLKTRRRMIRIRRSKVGNVADVSLFNLSIFGVQS